ncbi:MAG: hypothetical protein ACREDL_25415, partial [Bradyrhizobium sp.]
MPELNQPFGFSLPGHESRRPSEGDPSSDPVASQRLPYDISMMQRRKSQLQSSRPLSLIRPIKIHREDRRVDSQTD